MNTTLRNSDNNNNAKNKSLKEKIDLINSEINLITDKLSTVYVLLNEIVKDHRKINTTFIATNNKERIVH